MFSSEIAPKVTVNDFLFRIVKYTKVEISTFICCLIYFDRIFAFNDAKITTRNFHK